MSHSCRLVLSLLMVSVIAACAGGSGSVGGDTSLPRGKILACKSGDTPVNSSAQCLQDDAACYQKSDGAWCTGPRGNTCPTGSVEVASAQQCPANTRCFNVGESLTCGISY